MTDEQKHAWAAMAVRAAERFSREIAEFDSLQRCVALVAAIGNEAELAHSSGAPQGMLSGMFMAAAQGDAADVARIVAYLQEARADMIAGSH